MHKNNDTIPVSYNVSHTFWLYENLRTNRLNSVVFKYLYICGYYELYVGFIRDFSNKLGAVTTP